MKPIILSPNLTRALRVALAPILAVCLGLLVIPACKRREPPETMLPGNVTHYTCPMHLSVKMLDPKAKCPICNMNLVPVYKPGTLTNALSSSSSPSHDRDLPGHEHQGSTRPTPLRAAARVESPREFSVPIERQQQIGVTYASAERQPLKRSIRAVGSVTVDKRRHWNFVARVEGYVDGLHVYSRGELVEKGQPLLTLYSPDLLTTQREFVNLLRLRNSGAASDSSEAEGSVERLLESARRRLQQWSVAPEQIAELERSREPNEHLMLYSPFRGIVQDVAVEQGRKVMPGDHLVDVADLSNLWVWAEFYQEELPLVETGLPVTITTSAYPEYEFPGKVVLIDPFMNEATRTGRVRIDVENPGLKLRPGQFVDVEISLVMGEELTVPVTAILPAGLRNIAFVDKGEGRLEPRFVKLGGKFGPVYSVESGLVDGERVVNSANFLIDAEAKIQGALQSW